MICSSTHNKRIVIFYFKKPYATAKKLGRRKRREMEWKEERKWEESEKECERDSKKGIGKVSGRISRKGVIIRSLKNF
jgi:hypothetical protein